MQRQTRRLLAAVACIAAGMLCALNDRSAFALAGKEEAAIIAGQTGATATDAAIVHHTAPTSGILWVTRRAASTPHDDVTKEKHYV